MGSERSGGGTGILGAGTWVRIRNRGWEDGWTGNDPGGAFPEMSSNTLIDTDCRMNQFIKVLRQFTGGHLILHVFCQPKDEALMEGRLLGTTSTSQSVEVNGIISNRPRSFFELKKSLYCL